MPRFSGFWKKHYRDIKNCCMTAPLKDTPFISDPEENRPPEDLERKLIVDLIDIGWMHDKQLKWIGWDFEGWFCWTDSSGFLYRIKNLKRNEAGERWEKEVEKIARNGDGTHSTITYQNTRRAWYEYEMAIQKSCGFCPPEVRDSGGAEENNSGSSIGGIKEEEKKKEEKEEDKEPVDTTQSKATDDTETTETEHVTENYGSYGKTEDYVPNENEYGWAGGSGGGSEENPMKKDEIDRLPILPVRMMPVTNTKAVTNTRPVIGKSAQNDASDYAAGNGATAFGFANGIGQESTTTYPLSSASEQQKKMAQELINARRSQVLREGRKDADVYIRVVFEGPRDRNGEHNDVVIEEKLRNGNSNKPKEVYQIHVTGGLVNGSYNSGGNMVSRWITEPVNPTTPANPSGQQQLPTPITPWQPPTARVPPIEPPREAPPSREPPIEPPPTRIPTPLPTVPSLPPTHTRSISTPRPTFPFIRPTPPDPESLCLKCFNNTEQLHWEEGVRTLVDWLNKNPAYGIQIEADGDGSYSKNTWESILISNDDDLPKDTTETFLQRCLRRFLKLLDAIANKIPGFNRKRLMIKLGDVNGRRLRYHTFKI